MEAEMAEMKVAIPFAAVLALTLATLGCPEEERRREPRPDPIESTLNIVKAGDGRGIVRTLPAGLICDVDCDDASFVYEDVEEVTVITELGRNANLRRVRCEGPAGTDPLTVDTLDENDQAILQLPTITAGVGATWTCTADFALVHTLQVIQNQGVGSGRVLGTLSRVIGQDEPKRVDCASTATCVAAYFDGEEETVTATADAGSVFAGWDFCAEDDPQNPVVTLVMTRDENCRPRFDLQ